MISFVHQLVFGAIGIGILFKIWISKSVQDWLKNRRRMIEAASKLPGPRALPLIGNALKFACKADEIVFRILEMGRLYEGPFRWWLGPKLMVGIRKPRDIMTIMQSSNAAHKDSTYRFLESLFGRGLITASDPQMKANRKVIVAMLNKKTTNSYVKYFEQHSQRCVEKLELHVDTGEFDVYPYMQSCIVDSVLETIMGTPGITQLGGYQKLMSNISRMYKLVVLRMFKIWLQSDWIYACTSYKKLHDSSLLVIRQFVDSLVAQKKKEYHALQATSGVTGSPREPQLKLLEQLVAYNEETGLMDDDRLRDEILTVFLAAEDATTSVTSFTLLMLAMHPEIQEKVRAEVFEVIGEGSVTVETLPKLKYTSMVIKETLRLFPVAPVQMRQLTGDVQLESCNLPEGCTVTMMPFLVHRDPEFWTDPDKFDPDRFNPENSVGRHTYAYIPFSAGRRACIGNEYAVLYIKTLLAGIVRKYQLNSNSSLNEIKLKADVILRSASGYKISLTKL